MNRRSHGPAQESDSPARSETDRHGGAADPRRTGVAARLHRSVGNQAVQSAVDDGIDPQSGGTTSGSRDRTQPGEADGRPTETAGEADGRSTETAGGDELPDAVSAVLSTPGRRLDGGVRRSMEATLGGDFGDVRLHTGPLANVAARSVDARAFTLGTHIAFGHGEYDPQSSAGMETMAHELVHVRQQGGSAPQRLPENGDIDGIADPSDRHEREARRIARQVVEPGVDRGTIETPSPLSGGRSRVATLQRQSEESTGTTSGSDGEVSLAGTARDIIDQFTEAFAAVDEEVTGSGSLGGFLDILETAAEELDGRYVHGVMDLLRHYVNVDSGILSRLDTQVSRTINSLEELSTRAAGGLARIGGSAAKISGGITIVAVVAALAANYQKAQAKSVIARSAISLAQEGLMFRFATLHPVAAAVDAVFALVPGVNAPIGSTMKASLNTIGTMFSATLAWLNGDIDAAAAQATAMQEYLEEEGNLLFQMTQAGGEMMVSDQAAQWGAEGIADVYGEPGDFTLEYIVRPTDTATSAVGTGLESVGDALESVNPF